MSEPEAPLRLPWTGEFSPGQLGSDALRSTLEMVAAARGSRDQLIESIRLRWFSASAQNRVDPEERLNQQRRRSTNVLNGMQSYGLLERDCTLTALGENLLAESDDDTRTDAFVRHLLKYGKGVELLDAAQDVRSRGHRVTKKAVADELKRRGYVLTTNSTDPGKLRQWLGTAGVVDDKWVIDEHRMAELTGSTLRAINEFEALPRGQRAFLATLRRLGETRGRVDISSPELLDFVIEEHGRVFDESQVAKTIYRPLAKDGWILHTVKTAGRGGKGGSITPTSKLLDVDFELLTGFSPGDLPPDLRAVLATPREQVHADLDSSDTYDKGIALELLAVNIASDLGLVPLRLRVRGVSTGGAEVDLVAEGVHLHFSRWLFQCKNVRASVNVGVLAKEVGMATLLQAQVIVIATTSKFSATVRSYAERVNLTTPFQVILIDGNVLQDYRTGGAMALRTSFRADATAAMHVKRSQVLDALADLAEDDT